VKYYEIIAKAISDKYYYDAIGCKPISSRVVYRDIDISFTDIDVYTPKAKQDNKANSLHSEAYKLYQSANIRYRTESKSPKAYIKLNSSRRTCSKQANLYIKYIHHKYYGGKYSPPANQPGQSTHEYGLAIDVDLGKDKSQILAALRYAGWENTVSGEPWHYEAVNTSAWGRLSSIKNTNKRQSKEISVNIAEWFELRKKVESLFREYKSEYSKHDPERKRLKEEYIRLNKTKNDLNKHRSDIVRKDKRLQSIKRKIHALEREIDGLVYTWCPNKQPYSKCDHEGKKRKWRDYVANKRNKLQQLRAQYKEGANENADSAREYRDKSKNYERDLRKYDVDRREFNRLEKKLQALKRDIGRAKNRMDKKRSEFNKKISILQKSVGAWAIV
jgi:hypothetical protein